MNVGSQCKTMEMGMPYNFKIQSWKTWKFEEYVNGCGKTQK